MIAVKSVSKAYGSTQALSDVNFAVPHGSITALLGPNGAGKSTLMRIICGLENPDSGTVSIAGEALNKLKRPVQQIGAMLDPTWLDPRLSCAQFLRIQSSLLGIADSQASVARMLDKVGLPGVARKQVGDLSLGMKQRLALAAALLGDPQLLILDEPVNGLDPQGVKWIRSLLMNFRESGGTVLISSHLISEVQLIATHIAVISAGSLRYCGPVEALEQDRAAAQFSATSQSANEQLLGALQSLRRDLHFSIDDKSVTVQGFSSQEVFTIAAKRGIVLTSLTPYFVPLRRVTSAW
ncbi:ABC transporter ATP-binding protein [Arcanobacterium hippocoleae]|uniref:ABC transporter ATP-binding protein n=1 Tax=Arcanobacterium hippocoleae TaxID=149017 RepID=UPI0033415558